MTSQELYNSLNKEHREIIDKMLEIQDILINDPPNDKKFNKNQYNYMLEYINILNNVEFSDYSDKYLIKAIDNLYNKIFKHRRY